MSTLDLREIVRGIPTWEGARCVFRVNDVWHRGIVEYAAAAEVKVGPSACVPPRDVGPDLEGVDTQMAYIRRLVVARGCPESYADVGAALVESVAPHPRNVMQDRTVGWMLAAGPIFDRSEGGYFWRWSVDLDVDVTTTTRLLVLARAWPKT